MTPPAGVQNTLPTVVVAVNVVNVEVVVVVIQYSRPFNNLASRLLSSETLDFNSSLLMFELKWYFCYSYF